MSEEEVDRFMAAIEDLNKPTPADEVAQAFDDWQKLNRLIQADPNRVPPEVMAQAWDSLIEAHERWANSR